MAVSAALSAHADDAPARRSSVPDVTHEQARALALLNTKTKPIWVGARDGTVADFVPDSDPATVQFVILESDQLAAAAVSPDGQVVFLRAADLEAQDLRIHWLFMESGLRRLNSAVDANGQ